MDDSSQKREDKRLKVLEKNEIHDIYNRPVFTKDEQVLYFELSAPERAIVAQFGNKKSQVFFILHLGYFKARFRFFIFQSSEVKADIEFIQSLYFSDTIFPDDLTISKSTRLKQQDAILDLFDYRRADATQRDALFNRAKQAAQIFSKPIYIFRELSHTLEEERIVAPGYTVMQGLIGQAVTYEQNRLSQIMQQAVSHAEKQRLEDMLNNPHGLYEITWLKHEPRNFTRKEIVREVERGRELHLLYQTAQRILPQFQISNESITILRFFSLLLFCFSSQSIESRYDLYLSTLLCLPSLSKIA